MFEAELPAIRQMPAKHGSAAAGRVQISDPQFLSGGWGGHERNSSTGERGATN
jgi:hypothetical protein